MDNDYINENSTEPEQIEKNVPLEETDNADCAEDCCCNDCEDDSAESYNSEKFTDDLAYIAASAYEVSDKVIRKAVDVVVSTGKVSIPLLQRKMKIGYNYAGKVIERLANLGIVQKMSDGAYSVFASIKRSAGGEAETREESTVQDDAPEVPETIKENPAAKLVRDVTAYYAEIYEALGVKHAHAVAGCLIQRIGMEVALKLKNGVPEEALNAAIINMPYARDVAYAALTQAARISSGNVNAAEETEID